MLLYVANHFVLLSESESCWFVPELAYCIRWTMTRREMFLHIFLEQIRMRRHPNTVINIRNASAMHSTLKVFQEHGCERLWVILSESRRERMWDPHIDCNRYKWWHTRGACWSLRSQGASLPSPGSFTPFNEHNIPTVHLLHALWLKILSLVSAFLWWMQDEALKPFETSCFDIKILMCYLRCVRLYSMFLCISFTHISTHIISVCSAAGWKPYREQGSRNVRETDRGFVCL